MGPVVCMITDRHRLGDQAERGVVSRASVVASAGVHLIQVRERDLDDRALLSLVARTVEAVRGTRARVLVNDRLDVAVAAGAHGVHLRDDSPPSSRVRLVAPRGFLIGRSVHSPADAARVADEGAVDFLVFGTVFETASKPGLTPGGTAVLADVVRRCPRIPVLAIGGVRGSNVGTLRGTGCAGFAAIGVFADGPETALAANVANMRVAWERA